MDAHDTFGAGVDAPADDPFAGSEEEFSQTTDPLAEPPVVDREGNPVEPTQNGSSDEEQAMLAEAERLREEEAAAVAADPEPAQQELPPDPTSAASEAASPASSATPQETAPSPAAAAAAAPATPPGDAGPSSASATPPSDPPSTDAAASEEDAEPPAEKKDKKGNVTHRRYMLLQPDGEGKWAEVHWYEKDGKIVKQGTPGAKKQKVCAARGQEEALHIGFAALGSPSDGAKLVAVAATYFQLRHVAPDPVQPIRQRLSIR